MLEKEAVLTNDTQRAAWHATKQAASTQVGSTGLELVEVADASPRGSKNPIFKDSGPKSH